jgi:hypothetical protein
MPSQNSDSNTKPEPTFKKLKRMLSELEKYDERVDQHIKDELTRHEQRKSTESNQTTTDDSGSTGE